VAPGIVLSRDWSDLDLSQAPLEDIVANNSDYLFRVFDVVEVADRPPDTSGRMVVNQVRRHPDGSYTYEVGNADAMDGQDDWGGLYRESDLTGTGGRVDVELWDMPGLFDYRDVVTVSMRHDDLELRGQTGVVEGWCPPGEDNPETIGVWFAELERFDVVEPQDLTATGIKAPRPAPGDRATRTKVDTDGTVLGSEEYVVIDDLKFYLGK
jgi:hypothetical protein